MQLMIGTLIRPQLSRKIRLLKKVFVRNICVINCENNRQTSMYCRAIVLVLLLSSAVIALNLRDSAQDFFDSIPDDEKSYFLSYVLAFQAWEENEDHNLEFHPDDLNIPPELLEKFQMMYIPEKFPRDLYRWVCSKYNLGQREVMELAVRAEYCYPDGHCVDMNDVGSTCCPF